MYLNWQLRKYLEVILTLPKKKFNKDQALFFKITFSTLQKAYILLKMFS